MHAGSLWYARRAVERQGMVVRDAPADSAGRIRVAAALAPLALVLIGFAGCSGGVTSRPDVVAVTLDPTRADHLGSYGGSRAISPKLDRFALDAVLYRRAWSTDSWTLPAHASILTGKHPSSHG